MIAALPDQRCVCVALRMAQNKRNLLGMISKRREHQVFRFFEPIIIAGGLALLPRR